MRVLTDREVGELLPVADCIGIMVEAFRALGSGQVQQPLRTAVPLADGSLFLSMPAGQDGGPFGVKALAVLPGNAGTPWEAIQGVVILFAPGSPTVSAVLDAGALTSIRTAAVSGLATRLMARDDAGDLAMLGAGVQARSHLEAMAAVRSIRRVRVWSRSATRAEAWAAWARSTVTCPVEVASGPEQAVRDADLICTVTGSAEPVVRGEWVASGAHLNLVGAHRPDAREADSDLVVRARCVVDLRASAMAEAGDLLIPMSEGRIGPDHLVAELADLVHDRVRGRTDASAITLFKSLGLALEDLAAANEAWRRAEANAVGREVVLGARRPEEGA